MALRSSWFARRYLQSQRHRKIGFQKIYCPKNQAGRRRKARVDITLTVGAMSEEITVNGRKCRTGGNGVLGDRLLRLPGSK